MYTVKQLSDLAGVSVRTLHYYDEIDLLKPAKVGENKYRYYDESTLFRLQQILFYRELGIPLLQIKDVLDSPDFDLIHALQSHRKVIGEKIDRMQNLIETIDDTIKHVQGVMQMSRKKMFEAFNDEQNEEYRREARLQYGADRVDSSYKRWNNYSSAEKQAIMDEGNQIYWELTEALEAGKPTYDEEVQAILARWHQHLNYFYEPSLDMLRGLGMLYNSSSDFIANFQELHPDLPAFLEASIEKYVDDLETVEIERMLADDEADQASNLA